MFSIVVSSALALFISSLGYSFLTSRFNKKLNLFYKRSSKASTGAVLMGGIPLLFAVISSVLCFLLLDQKLTNPTVTKVFYSFIISSLILGIGGWIDDKFEIRARYKLAFQLVAVGIYSFQVSQIANHQIQAFFFFSFIGMALVNGSNLLDGLDTMIIKLKAAIYLGFICLAYKFQFDLLWKVATLGIIPLIAFYPFNRSPSRIHQGEVGSSYLGFFTLFLFSLALLTSPFNSGEAMSPKLFSSALIVLSFPVIELAISFSRRVWNKKSPFIGDRQHLHHILRSHYKLNSKQTTTLMMSYIIVTNLIALTFITNQNFVFTLITSYTSSIVLYYMFCRKAWSEANDSKRSDIFLNFPLSKVEIINPYTKHRSFMPSASKEPHQEAS